MSLGDCDFTLSCGFHSHVGTRPSMEDRSAVLPSFLPHKVGFFAVFDGHNGEKVADFCANKFPEVLQKELPFNLESSKDWEATLHNTFRRVDTEAQATAPQNVGSTVVAAVITSSLILVANCGDSRAVLCRGKDVVALSVDHKPNRPDELARIEASGGVVIDWGGCSRVCGVLAVSRSIGDTSMKPFVIAEPEIQVVNRTDEDDFLILASDGLWDVFSNKDVIDMARKCLRYYEKKNKPDLDIGHGNDVAAKATAKYIAKMALQKGSRDNLTIVVINMKGSRFCS